MSKSQGQKVTQGHRDKGKRSIIMSFEKKNFFLHVFVVVVCLVGDFENVFMI